MAGKKRTVAETHLYRQLILVGPDLRQQEVMIEVEISAMHKEARRPPDCRFQIGPPIALAVPVWDIENYGALLNCLHLLRAHLLRKVEAFGIPGLHGQLQWRGVRDLGFPVFVGRSRRVPADADFDPDLPEDESLLQSAPLFARPISGTLWTFRYPIEQDITGNRTLHPATAHSLTFAAPIEVEGGWSCAYALGAPFNVSGTAFGLDSLDAFFQALHRVSLAVKRAPAEAGMRPWEDRLLIRFPTFHPPHFPEDG